MPGCAEGGYSVLVLKECPWCQITLVEGSTFRSDRLAHVVMLGCKRGVAQDSFCRWELLDVLCAKQNVETLWKKSNKVVLFT
jgi:hypothetical protein